MRHEARVIGVLDVQQAVPGAFGEGDVTAVQALADLVAAMYRDGQLFRQLQQSVVAERRAYAELSARAWLERARLAEEVSYRYENGRVRRLTTRGSGGPIRSAGQSLQQAWPLSIRGRFAGLVEAQKPADQGDWTDAERQFIETVIEQLGPALENARLLEDAQSRAARDRLLADVTARTRETLDLDTVLRTAADEIYAALGLQEVVIQLIPSSGEQIPTGELD
jgi:GAF domain-containing protein